MSVFAPASQALAALSCPAPNHQPLGTAWCDADPTRYKSDLLCLAEPVEGPASSSIDQDVVGGGVCVLGKFKSSADVTRLADFVISYDFPADPLMGPSGVVIPDLSAVTSTAEFLTNVPLAEEGVYDLSIQALALSDTGSLQQVRFDRRVVRVSVPHLTVTNVRTGGSTADCSTADPTCFGVSAVPGDSDGDGICDEAPAIPGLCTAGPDLVDDNGAAANPHVVRVAQPSSAARSLELCINSHDDEPPAGSSILVRAINTIKDESVAPLREIMVESTCANPGSDICQASSDNFCPGGYKVNVPLGHGENNIELYVNNLVTGYDIGAAQNIQVMPFDMDLKGPDLCVNVLNEAGVVIPNVDGRSLLANDAQSATIDVTLGKCGQTPEEISANSPEPCDPATSPACANSAVCLQANNAQDSEGAPQFVAMCERTVGGQTHYQAKFPELRFPINTALITAGDDAGNRSVETHAFGYGNIRPVFTQGQLDVRKAMVDSGVAGFVKESFVKNEVLPLILKVANSNKFLNQMFFKLLDPHQPGDDEIACLRSIENETNCNYNHFTNRNRTVAIKTFCDGDCTDEIGSIEIPTLTFLDQNRLRLQLKVNGFRGRAEMYTMQFIDSDNDGVVDTEDDDADNDGICDRQIPAIGKCEDENHDGVCDKEISLNGSLGEGLNAASPKCVLDKSVARASCPDIDADDRYFGCQDLDDDNDGVADAHDLPGRLVQDPDFNIHVIPLKFTMKTLTLNLDASFEKTPDGRLHVQITNTPGQPLLKTENDRRFPIEFDCGKDISEIYQGGSAQDVGNGQNWRIWREREACLGLEALNPTADQALFGDKDRKMQSTRKQLQCTVDALARCSIPRRLDATLERFEENKVAPLSVELLNKRFHMDFFAPLGSADVTVDPRGLGFRGKGLLVPAGVSGADDEAERDGKTFVNALPAELKTHQFGPLSQDFDQAAVDPISLAFEMGQETNIAINEETINSALHSVGTLLWDLSRREGDDHQFLDLNLKKIRQDFDLGIPDIGSSQCKDENGEVVAENDWKCFPFPLNLENILGPDTLKYVDFDGDSVSGGDHDKLAPITIRNTLNPFYPPTVKLVSVTPILTSRLGDLGDGRSDPVGIKTYVESLIAEIEIGLGNTQMSLFEERVADWNATPIVGTGEIKDWCDSDRYPGARSAECDAGRKLPMVTFNVSGSVFVTLKAGVMQKGLLKLEGGLSSITPEDGPVALDTSKTHLEFTVVENNTIVPDAEIAAAFKRQIDTLLPKYLFRTERDIRKTIPLKLPLQDYCAVYGSVDPETCECVRGENEGDDCNLVDTLDDFWESADLDDFGLLGITIDNPLLGVNPETRGDARYLLMGTGITFKLQGGSSSSSSGSFLDAVQGWF